MTATTRQPSRCVSTSRRATFRIRSESRPKCRRIFEEPGACQEQIMEQQSELRNGIVSDLESSMSTADVLEPNRPLDIVHGRRCGFSSPICSIITSGSFNPCPVTVQQSDFLPGFFGMNTQPRLNRSI